MDQPTQELQLVRERHPGRTTKRLIAELEAPGQPSTLQETAAA